MKTTEEYLPKDRPDSMIMKAIDKRTSPFREGYQPKDAEIKTQMAKDILIGLFKSKPPIDTQTKAVNLACDMAEQIFNRFNK